MENLSEGFRILSDPEVLYVLTIEILRHRLLISAGLTRFFPDCFNNSLREHFFKKIFRWFFQELVHELLQKFSKDSIGIIHSEVTRNFPGIRSENPARISPEDPVDLAEIMAEILSGVPVILLHIFSQIFASQG